MENNQFISKISFFLILFFLMASCFEPSKRSQENYENLKKIKIGMHMEEVKKIMGNPYDISIEPVTEKNYWFLYNSPSGMSDNFYIYISRKDSVVVGINDGS